MLAPARTLLACSLALTLGCSVDGIDTVFGNPAEGGRSAGGQGPGGAGQGATGQGGVPVTDDVVTATTDDATVTSTSNSTVTSGPSTSTSTTTGGPSDITVFCDGDNCVPGQVCCYYQFEAGQDFCAAPDSCPDQEGWVQMACNGPDDCGGGECCGWFSQQTGWGTIECRDQCEVGQVELCFGDPSACEGANQSCSPSQALGFGYSYCGGG